MLIWIIGNTALFAVKKFAIGVAVSIPLIVVIFLFRFAVHANFERPIKMVAIHAAADLDRADQVRLFLGSIWPSLSSRLLRLLTVLVQDSWATQPAWKRGVGTPHMPG
jgi:hypothetical protein